MLNGVDGYCDGIEWVLFHWKRTFVMFQKNWIEIAMKHYVWQQLSNSQGMIGDDSCFVVDDLSTGVRTDSNWGHGRRTEGWLVVGDRTAGGALNERFKLRNEWGKRV